MEEIDLKQPELIGRETELEKLRSSLDNAVAGTGSTIFIGGEAGIGKTRIVNELVRHAEGCKLVSGWCLTESLEPLMPIRTALRDAELLHLMSGESPPLVVSAYLMTDAGMLIAKAEREQMELDPDIFAGMLKAVGNFVKDSLALIGSEGKGGLNSLGYADYNILMRSEGKLSIAMVIKGQSSEFLIEDMKGTMAHFGDTLDGWMGDMEAEQEAAAKLAWFLESGKYDGKVLVDDPKLKQENLFDNVLLGLQRAAEGQPIILFLDDLQWADPSTVNLIHFLARNMTESRVLTLCAYRPEELLADNHLKKVLQLMNREGVVQEIKLPRLPRDATDLMLAQVLGCDDVDPVLSERLFVETDGNPFFVLEVIRLLLEEGSILRSPSGEWHLKSDASIDLPGRVHDVVARRLAALPPEFREVLECASVLGSEFPLDMLQNVSGAEKMALLKKLGELEKSYRLISYEKGRYRFDHTKFRDVLYAEMGGGLREEVHRQTADFLIDSGDGNAAEIGKHLYQARDGRALKFITMAAEQASSIYAMPEAARLYEMALETATDKLELSVKAIAVYKHTAQYEKGLELCNGLLSGSSGRGRGLLLALASELHEKAGNWDDAISTAEESRAILEPEGASPELSKTFHALSYAKFRKGEPEEAEAWARKNLEMAAGLGDDKLLATAEHDLGTMYIHLRKFDMATPHLERAAKLRESIGDLQGLGTSLNNLGTVQHHTGNWRPAQEYYRKALAVKEKVGDVRGLASTITNLGLIERMMGNLLGAIQIQEKGLKMRMRIGDMRGTSNTYSAIGLTWFDMFDFENARHYMHKALEIEERISDLQGMGISCTNLGDIYFNLANLEEATTYLLRGLEMGERLKDGVMYSHNLMTMSELLASKGDLEGAEKALEKARSTMEEIGSKDLLAEWSRAAGVVSGRRGDWEAASKNYHESIGMFRDMADPAPVVKTLLYKARTAAFLGLSGEVDKAMAEALETARVQVKGPMAENVERLRPASNAA